VQLIWLLPIPSCVLPRCAQDGWTPLHHAAHGGHVDILGDLIKARGDVNVQSTNGSTPLMWASEAEDARAVKML